MSNPAPFPKRPRAKFSRSREGCQTCRNRHKKCDGQRPSCAACTLRGLPCEWLDGDDAPAPANSGDTSTMRDSRENTEVSSHTQSPGLTGDNSQDVARSLIATWSGLSQEQELVNLRTSRSQIRALAMPLLGPRGCSRIASTVSLLQESLEEAESTAATFAFDALALTQLGVSWRDDEVLECAIRSYYRAVNTLREELATAATPYSDALVAAPYLLFLCEQFRPIALLSGNQGETTHLHGFSQLLSADGAVMSTFQLLLLDDYEQCSLAWSLTRRQHLPRLLKDDDVQALNSHDRFPRLTRLMMDLPSVIDKADELAFHASLSTEADDSIRAQAYSLLRELRRQQDELQAWFRSWYADSSTSPCSPVDAHLLPASFASLDRLSCRIFETSFTFISFGTAVAYVRFWESLLLLFAIEVEVNTYLEYPVQRRADGTKLADQIARVLISLCGTPEHGSQGYLWVAGALQYIHPWYVESAEEQRVKWCEALRDFISMKGMYVPVLGSRPRSRLYRGSIE